MPALNEGAKHCQGCQHSMCSWEWHCKKVFEFGQGKINIRIHTDMNLVSDLWAYRTHLETSHLCLSPPEVCGVTTQGDKTWPQDVSLLSVQCIFIFMRCRYKTKA